MSIRACLALVALSISVSIFAGQLENSDPATAIAKTLQNITGSVKTLFQKNLDSIKQIQEELKVQKQANQILQQKVTALETSIALEKKKKALERPNVKDHPRQKNVYDDFSDVSESNSPIIDVKKMGEQLNTLKTRFAEFEGWLREADSSSECADISSEESDFEKKTIKRK